MCSDALSRPVDLLSPSRLPSLPPSLPPSFRYMRRLGLYGRENGTLFEDLDAFLHESGFKRSIGALELISLNLKSQGKYAARALSFQDTSFKIEQVPMAEEFRVKYDKLVGVWYEGEGVGVGGLVLM